MIENVDIDQIRIISGMKIPVNNDFFGRIVDGYLKTFRNYLETGVVKCLEKTEGSLKIYVVYR